ncbi:encapsidation protein 22K [Human adenovirus 41]|uniref:Encapsidation protein 22K n=1 Tax=Human adenovirus F serotype 41 TaxID=10524 RepID=A0A7U3NJI2_ADE41|nr:encapsidation protein 22K [Human adenovirus 41]
MPPKGNKQAIANRRSQKQQKLQEQWDEEEESWDDSQAEEVSDEEEMESWESLDEELEDKPPKDEEEEIIASAAAPSSKEPARSQPPTGKVGPSPPRPGLLKASRRWDTVSIAGSPPAPVGKQPTQTRRGYCSWRPYKSNIVACLQHCRGNISFARRYLLFHDGVAVPRNVLYYYRHLYSPYETLGENNSAALGKDFRHCYSSGYTSRAGTKKTHLSHAVCYFPAESRSAAGTESKKPLPAFAHPQLLVSQKGRPTAAHAGRRRGTVQ